MLKKGNFSFQIKKAYIYIYIYILTDLCNLCPSLLSLAASAYISFPIVWLFASLHPLEFLFDRVTYNFPLRCSRCFTWPAEGTEVAFLCFHFLLFQTDCLEKVDLQSSSETQAEERFHRYFNPIVLYGVFPFSVVDCWEIWMSSAMIFRNFELIWASAVAEVHLSVEFVQCGLSAVFNLYLECLVTQIFVFPCWGCSFVKCGCWI